MLLRNSLKSLAVSSDSEPEVEPFITQTKAALVAVLQELSENNLNLHLRVQKTSKQLTISIFAPRIFRPTCMFIDKEDSGEGSLHNCTWQGNSTFYKEQLAKKNRQHSWKVKLPNLKSDLLKTNEDGALQSRGIVQTFVWWGVRTCPPPYKRLVFLDQYLRSLWTYHL